MSETVVFARVPFTYSHQDLERGEIVTLKGTPRDEQLRGLGFLVAFDPHEHRKLPCDSCGRKFVSDGFLLTHKRKAGGCLAPSPDITKDETAMLLNVDPKKVVVEE